MSLGALFKADAALVGDDCERFLDEQTFLRCRRENATAMRILYDFGVIALWVIGEDGEFKTILAVRLGVAGSGVASGSA